VAELQVYLRKIGYPSTKDYTDGLYGSVTKAAWAKSATARGLNPQFDRASGTEAIVDAQTLSAIAKGVSIDIKPTPTPAPQPVPELPLPAPGAPNIAPLLVFVGVIGLGAWWLLGKKPAFARAR